MLQNLFHGLDAMGLYLKSVFLGFVFHPVVLGFLIGFFASTGIHMILIAQNGQQLKSMILKPADRSYIELHSANNHGAYDASYSQFLRDYHRVRIAFYSAVTVFMATIMIVLMRF